MKGFSYTVLILAAIALVFYYLLFYAPNNFEGDRIVVISRGENFSQITDTLEAKGVLSNKLFFELAARWRKFTTRIQIGKYRFKSGMSNTDILEDLRYGTTVEWITVSVPEGMTAQRQARVFRRHLGIDSSKFMSFVISPVLAKQFGSESLTLEGYLLPSTYKFYWQTDERVIVQTMVQDFWKYWNDSIAVQAQAKKMTLTQILALASIIDGETRIDSERAIIAGVYMNRIKKGIPLQADPTIQYVITDGPRVLKHGDTKIPSPYNTYLHRGMPPGPVNNPGRASIFAALHPKKVPYLYFVANGKGGHTFTKTYQEHLHAVQKLKKIREEQDTSKATGNQAGKPK
ncbi:MAG: endolytic transglycosylase MltG [Bacteroidota bacterium]